MYTFGTFTLGAGRSVVLRTGKGTNTSAVRFWGMSRYVWNNPGDEAIVRDPAGATMDTCAWTTLEAGYVSCP